MANVNAKIKLGYKPQAWFDANAALVLDPGQTVHLSNNPPLYKIGDGSTPLQDLDFSNIYSEIVAADLAAHMADVANPHAVTKSQVGLGNVQNVDQTNADNISSGTISDARLSANVTVQGNAFNGIQQLVKTDINGKVLSSILPAIAITDTFVVASEAAMLALTAETGDIAVRTDETKSYVLMGTDPSDLGDWQLLLSPTGAVISVNGQTGVVSLDTDDIAEGSTNLYYTTARFDTRFATKKVADLATSTKAEYNANCSDGDFIFEDDSRLTDARLQKILSDSTAGPVTGTTSQTIAKSIKIPGGTFTVGDEFELQSLLTKGTIGSSTIRYYLNNTDDLVTPTQIGQFNFLVANMYVRMPRRFFIRSATETIGFDATTTAATDLTASSAGGISIHNIDWTVDQYFLVTATNSTTLETTTCENLSVAPLKKAA